jgi:type II secretory pathway component PulK
MRDPRRGVVLLVVLIVVAMLALGAYSFVQLMNTEARAAQMYGRQVQAREAADSGVHFAAAVLLDQKFAGSLGADIYDASDMFNGQVVTDESADVPRLRSRFSLVAPVESGANVGSMRYGVVDEASKINLNTLIQQLESQGSQAGAATGGGDRTEASGAGASDAATSNPLLYLPAITQEIADAILDWLDADDTPRQYGAESDYYQSLNPPYEPRNGPMHSLDELLLVAGVTPRLLYGEDANRNGVLDPNEDDGEQSSPIDDGNGILDRGWLPYVTLYSRETNTDILGLPRIFLNNQDLQALYDELAADADFGEEQAKFIVAYRLFGPASSGQQGATQGEQAGSQSGQPGGQPPPGQQGGQQGGAQGPQQGPPMGQPSQGQPSGGPPQGQPQGQGQTPTEGSAGSSGSAEQKTIGGLDASGGAKQEIQSVLDLVGISVNVRIPGQQNTTELKSPFQESDYSDFLDVLVDRTTTIEKKELWGRINVNTAPWPALMSLPGLTEDLGDAIVAARGTSDSASEAMSNLGVAWLLTSGAVTKDQFKKMETYITGQTQVFRVQAIGYFEQGGPQARIEAVLDLSGSSPRIRFWRDLSGHGRGFDPQVLMSTVGQ